MSMSAGGGGGGAKSEINVTPLVDVCLVLLIIFMVLVPRNVPEISVRSEWLRNSLMMSASVKQLKLV